MTSCIQCNTSCPVPLRDCISIVSARSICIFAEVSQGALQGTHRYCQVRLDQICDLLQVSYKPVLTCSMVGLSATKPSPPPGFFGEEVVWLWTPSRSKNKTCQRAEELLVSQRLSISSVQLCLRMSSCSWVTFYEEVGGRICTPATVKPFIPQNTKTQKNLKNHSVGVPPWQLPFASQLTG